MKNIRFVLALPLLIALLPLFDGKESRALIEIGDIEFVSLKSSGGDGFTIQTNIDIPVNTHIHFSDSEWNGNHFGADENTLFWNSGTNIIPSGTLISFHNLNSTPKVSKGNLKGQMNISKNNDAVFAFFGSPRLPTQFLAAAANDTSAFGTLLNTKLRLGQTARIFE